MKTHMLLLIPLVLAMALFTALWRSLAGQPLVATAASPRLVYDVRDSDACGSGVIFQWVDATGGQRWDLDAADLDLPDFVSVTLPLSQSFAFYGENYDHVWFNDFGAVLFGDENLYDDDVPSGNPPIPNDTPDDPNGAIYAAWGNIYFHPLGQSGMAVYTLHETSQGRNWFVIEYHGYENLFGGLDTFEIILDLDTGDVIVQYLTMSDATFAVAGIEDQTGTEGILYVDEEMPAANALHDGLAIWYGEGAPPTAPAVAIEPATATGGGLPGEVVTYTFTVSNTGGIADSYALTLADAYWPTTLWNADFTAPLTQTETLLPCTGAAFGVMISLPANPVVSSDVTVVQATSQLTSTVTATATIVTSNAGPGVNLTPPLQQGGLPGSVITYSLAVTNTGAVSDQYNLILSGFSWPTAFTPPLTQTGLLAAGAAQSVLATVTVPEDVAIGDTDQAILLATSVENAGTTLSTTLTTTALAAPAVWLSPGQAATAPPQAVVTYTVWLTNTSLSVYNYDVSLAAQWDTALLPPLAQTGPLTPGQALSVTLLVTVPSGALAGAADTAIFRLSTPIDPTFGPTTTVTTTAAAAPAFFVDGDTSAAARPGEVATYTLGLENVGNITDTYALALSGSAWPARFSPPLTQTEALPPAASLLFQVVVTVPMGMPAGVADTALLTIASLGFADVFTTTTLTTTAAAAPAIALPDDLSGGALPGTSITYVVTVTNAGNVPDSYTMTLTTPGWFTQFGPPFNSSTALLADVPAGDSRAVTVIVTLSPLAQIGAEDTVTVQAVSTVDPNLSASIHITTQATHGAYPVYLPIYAGRP